MNHGGPTPRTSTAGCATQTRVYVETYRLVVEAVVVSPDASPNQRLRRQNPRTCSATKSRSKRRQTAKPRTLDSKVRGPRSKVRGPRSKVRGPRSKVRGPRSKVSRNRIKKKRCSTSALRPHSYIIHQNSYIIAPPNISRNESSSEYRISSFYRPLSSFGRIRAVTHRC
jgi:hypothetical protein